MCVIPVILLAMILLVILLQIAISNITPIANNKRGPHLMSPRYSILYLTLGFTLIGTANATCGNTAASKGARSPMSHCHSKSERYLEVTKRCSIYKVINNCSVTLFTTFCDYNGTLVPVKTTITEPTLETVIETASIK